MRKEVEAQPPLALKDGQIDVWLTCLCENCRDTEVDCLQFLNEAEKTKWKRFVAKDAQLQYLVSHALVRTTLSRYGGLPANAWEFETNRYGRPRICDWQAHRGIQFNLSNTTGLVVCAVARGINVGIDVENADRVLDLDELAPTVFALKELEDFNLCSPAARRDRFFSYWTLKESYIKARGMGLSISLDSFWFDISGPSPFLHVTERANDELPHWWFYQFFPTDKHKGAIAVSRQTGAEPSIHFRWITPTATEPLPKPRCLGSVAATAIESA
jgi:4'-phosphopantetheinyl transferase